MDISNEKKARELAIKYCKDIDSSGNECYNIGCEIACNEAMQWKDEERKQEKQQWIEKAVIFLNERVCTEMSIPEIHNMIVDFKQAMKGE